MLNDKNLNEYLRQLKALHKIALGNYNNWKSNNPKTKDNLVKLAKTSMYRISERLKEEIEQTEWLINKGYQRQEDLL